MRKLFSFATVLVLLLGLAGRNLSADDAKPPKAGAKNIPIPPNAKAELEQAGLKVTSGRLSLAPSQGSPASRTTQRRPRRYGHDRKAEH